MLEEEEAYVKPVGKFGCLDSNSDIYSENSEETEVSQREFTDLVSRRGSVNSQESFDTIISTPSYKDLNAHKATSADNLYFSRVAELV
jgi:hypothetical protein